MIKIVFWQFFHKKEEKLQLESLAGKPLLEYLIHMYTLNIS